MYSKRSIFAAIILAGAALLSGGTAFGTQVPLLTLTENSSNSLTATLVGTLATVSVQNTSPDHWTLTFADTGVITTVTGSGSWTEPDNGREGNFVGAGQLSSQLIVISDDPDQEGMANGTTATTGFALNGGLMQVQFNDNGDGHVPDATSTLPLLSFALAGLGILAKRRKG